MAEDPIEQQPANTVTDPNLEEQIRRRAYELYQARAREDGHDVEDWLDAEAEIAGTAAKAATA